MTFRFAHKLATYLTVACAFMTVALSGEIGALAVLLALVGIVGSWWFEPPRIRFESWTAAWTALSSLMFAGAVVLWFAGGETLLVGTQFLLYLLVAKLFARRRSKDYQQLYVLAFLMLVAGTVLNAGFSYGLFFLGFVVCSTWALILFHLRRELEDNIACGPDGTDKESPHMKRVLDSRRIVSSRFFLGTSLVSVVVFASATVLFLAIPRVGLGLFFPKRRSSINMVGFDDQVQLGGHGRLKTDPTIVMRVKVDESFEGRRAPTIHWRGVAFDRYEHGSWTRSRMAPKTEIDLEPKITQRKTLVHLRYDRFGTLPTTERQRRTTSLVRQEMYLEPMGNDVLFGASMPMTFELEGIDPREHAHVNDELRMNHGAGIKYVVYSEPEPPPVKALRAAGTKLPVPSRVTRVTDTAKRTFDVYLQIPKSWKDDEKAAITALAKQMTTGQQTWYDKAQAIEASLRTAYAYTLDMVAPPPGMDPVYFFLFERKRGHCEYYSSAMVLLLRTLGIPARSVNGFLGGAWNEYDGYIAVRNGDAHSWVEIYFPGHGWVTFDPTPPGQAIAASGRGSTDVFAKLQRFMDTLRFKWFKWVIEYDLHQQLQMFKSIRRSLSSGQSFTTRFKGVKTWFHARKRDIALGILAVTAIAVALLFRRRKQQGASFDNQSRQLTRERGAMATVYTSVLTRYSRCGHHRPPAATPREFARSLTQTNVAGAGSLEKLTEVYYHAMYSDAARNDSITLLAQAKVLRDACFKELKHARRHKP